MITMSVGDLHGDLHALEKAIELFEKEKHDKLIFIGDYVDSYDYTNVEIIHLLETVIQYKKDNPDKVELLLGNHDWQYYNLNEIWFRCSGFRISYCYEIHDLFMNNRELFNIAYKKGDYLFTHAGITNKWYDNYLDRLYYYCEKQMDMKNDFHTILNKIKDTNDRWILSTVGKIRGGFGVGGPLWADKSEMGKFHNYRGFKQIVGHTRINNIKAEPWDVTFIDCLKNRLNFLTINHE